MGIFSPQKVNVPPPPPLPPAANPPSMASGAVQASGEAARARMLSAAGSGFSGTSKTGPSGVQNAPTANAAITGGLKKDLGA